MVIVALTFECNLICGLPVFDPATGQLYQNITSLDDIPGYNSHGNTTKKQLYVIKAAVYEIGILTEVDGNGTDELQDYEDEDQKQVDLTFFSGHQNGSLIDLGDIPLPIQEQINGQILTGIAPVHIGTIENPEDLLQTLPLTGTIFNISNSENPIVHLSTRNLTEAEQPTLISNVDFEDIPVVANSIPVLPEAIQNSPFFDPISLNNKELQENIQNSH
jgi:hypothetical protein